MTDPYQSSRHLLVTGQSTTEKILSKSRPIHFRSKSEVVRLDSLISSWAGRECVISNNYEFNIKLISRHEGDDKTVNSRTSQLETHQSHHHNTLTFLHHYPRTIIFPYFYTNWHFITSTIWPVQVNVWAQTRVYQELVGFVRPLLIITDVNIQCRS